MKTIIATAVAFAMFSTFANAGDGRSQTSVTSHYNSLTGDTTITTTKTTSRQDGKTCWAASGNWVNAAKTSCAFNSGGTEVSIRVIKGEPTKSE